MSAIVNVAVPEAHLGEVYALLGRLSKDEPAAPEASKSDQDWWTEKRLRRAFEESSPAQQAILRAMAEANGKWISVSEVAAQVGDKYDWSSLAGALGAFGRRSRNRYKAKVRPFTRRYNPTKEQKEYLCLRRSGR
ncbi:MAG: hypothetical protein ACR2MC_03425 [Actinomycetota bacterium]